MSWNYRLMAIEHDDEIYIQVHEVYYEDDKPVSYTEGPITMGGENIGEIKWSIDKINEGLKKPTLWWGDKFPQEYPVP